MRQKSAPYGIVGVAAFLSLLGLSAILRGENFSHPEARFFLLRALAVRYLPDPAQGILATHPSLPLLLALAFREYFPHIVGWSVAFALLLFGARRRNLFPALLVLFSPVYIFGALMRPALTLFSFFVALGFSVMLQSTTKNALEELLIGNLAFGFGTSLHPFGLWLLPFFALCEALLFQVPLHRRGTLAALALFPSLVFQGMSLFFGWVYEGYALSAFRNPELSLEAFLKTREMLVQAQNGTILALPLLCAASFSGIAHTIVLWGIFALSLLAPHLVAPFTSLLLAFLCALDPNPKKGALFGLLLWNALGWVLAFCGFPSC